MHPDPHTHTHTTPPPGNHTHAHTYSKSMEINKNTSQPTRNMKQRHLPNRRNMYTAQATQYKHTID